jgi:hypothetical protein
MAQNMGLIFDSREQVYGEIDVLYSSQGCDPMAVNQRVAGSSPADGAIYSKPQGRGVSRVADPNLGNNLGNTQGVVMEKHSYKGYEIVYNEVEDYYAVFLPGGGFEGLETLEEAKQFIDAKSPDTP